MVLLAAPMSLCRVSWLEANWIAALLEAMIACLFARAFLLFPASPAVFESSCFFAACMDCRHATLLPWRVRRFPISVVIDVFSFDTAVLRSKNGGPAFAADIAACATP